MFPLLINRLELLLAISILVQFTTHKPCYEIAVLVHDVFASAAGNIDTVAVKETLRYQGEFSEDSGVPLDDVFLGSTLAKMVKSKKSQHVPKHAPPPSENCNSDKVDQTTYPRKTSPIPPFSR